MGGMGAGSSGTGSAAVRPSSVQELQAEFAARGYLADEGLATAVFLAMRLRRPLLLEGEAGVGKTEVANVLAAWTGGELIRLQCYEGIDASQAIYEWDYSRQLLHLRAAEMDRTVGDGGTSGSGNAGISEGAPGAGNFEGVPGTRAARAPVEDELYSERFLVRRPLLRALQPAPVPPVLLIDEIDRADDEFEALLLEVLHEFSVTVPELGTFSAATPPLVVMTSNRTRDLHDALKRRCLYHWIDHPTFDQELAIVRLRAPFVSEMLARQVSAAVEAIRDLGLYKPPGVAETIEWAGALHELERTTLGEDSLRLTLGVVVKHHEDQQRLREHGFAAIVEAALAREG